MSAVSEIYRRVFTFCSVGVAMVLVGSAIGPLADGASRATRPEGVVFSPSDRGALGEGVLLASLGGLRTLIADGFWLRAYVMWERKDRAACSAFAEAACRLAPESAYFRKEYANWLALDFPAWTVRRLGGANLPDRERDAVYRADADSGLAMLDDAMTRLPDAPSLPMAAGDIVLRRLKDRPRAMDYYRRSAETTAAPWYPAMEYMLFLWDTGRGDEALRWSEAYERRRPAGEESLALRFSVLLATHERRAEAESWLASVVASRREDTRASQECAGFLAFLRSGKPLRE